MGCASSTRAAAINRRCCPTFGGRPSSSCTTARAAPRDGRPPSPPPWRSSPGSTARCSRASPAPWRKPRPRARRGMPSMSLRASPHTWSCAPTRSSPSSRANPTSRARSWTSSGVCSVASSLLSVACGIPAEHADAIAGARLLERHLKIEPAKAAHITGGERGGGVDDLSLGVEGLGLHADIVHAAAARVGDVAGDDWLAGACLRGPPLDLEAPVLKRGGDAGLPVLSGGPGAGPEEQGQEERQGSTGRRYTCPRTRC